jgi:hypothetical protein
VATQPKGIASFMSVMAANGGMSYSNNFDVEFSFTRQANSPLLQRFNSFGYGFKQGNNITGSIDTIQSSSPGAVLKMFCDEAQLPNIQAATGQLTGRFLGEGQINYPHTKMYSDFQLSWMCDANMTPLKFLNLWYGFIFQDYNPRGEAINPDHKKRQTLLSVKSGSGASGGDNAYVEKTVRLHFPDEYLGNIIVTKTEKGKSAANSRAAIAYTMIDCFPYSIDAVPLSYGASQVTKVSANFYYAKHQVTFNDIRGFDG